MKISFTKIDNNLIVDKEIDSNTFRVYVYIISLYNKEKGYSFPSIRTISDRLGISTPTIQKAIKKLKQLNYIVVEQIKSTANNIMNIYKDLKYIILDEKKNQKKSYIENQVDIVNSTNFKYKKERYDNNKGKNLKFLDYKQREYNWKELEEELLGWD